MTEKDELPKQKSYTENEGVRFFGEIKELLSGSEVEKIQTTPASILHVSRHLKKLNPEARKKILSFEGVTDDFITAQLQTVGSKFHEKIDDPYKLLKVCHQALRDKISGAEKIPWLYSKEVDEFEAIIKIELSPEQKQSLGLNPNEYAGDVSVIEITPEIENQITKEQRGKGEKKDHIEVNVISGVDLPETDTLIISLKKKNQDSPPELYTAYTGIIAPSLPRKEEQSEEEFSYNKSWWDNHAFIK